MTDTDALDAYATTEMFLSHLRQVAEIRRGANDHDSLRVWTGPEELVLGMAGDPVVVEALTLPDGVESGPVKACFTNAFNAAAIHPNLIYTEGYGYAGFFPVTHAWCVDRETGAIVDPTWVNLSYGGPFVYLGMSFTREFMARLIEEYQDASVFESDWRRKGRTARSGLLLNADGHVYDWGDPPPF